MSDTNSNLLAYRAKTLAQLRLSRGVLQGEIARRIGVQASGIARLEAGDNPTLSSLDAYVDALGGRLILLAVFPNADGSYRRDLIRMESDQRRDHTVNLLTARRWREPAGARSTRDGYTARLAARTEHIKEIV